MENLQQYVKPELLVVSAVLYFIGMGLKKSQFVKDKFIPLILGGLGILVCGVYVFASCDCQSAQKIAMAFFTSFTQGILVAGLSTYVNQLFKQAGKSQ